MKDMTIVCVILGAVVLINVWAAVGLFKDKD